MKVECTNCGKVYEGRIIDICTTCGNVEIREFNKNKVDLSGFSNQVLITKDILLKENKLLKIRIEELENELKDFKNESRFD